MFCYYENGRNKWVVRDGDNSVMQRFDTKAQALSFIQSLGKNVTWNS